MKSHFLKRESPSYILHLAVSPTTIILLRLVLSLVLHFLVSFLFFFFGEEKGK